MLSIFILPRKKKVFDYGFEINITRWVILIPTNILHSHLRPVMALFDVQYFYSTCNTVWPFENAKKPDF